MLIVLILCLTSHKIDGRLLTAFDRQYSVLFQHPAIIDYKTCSVAPPSLEVDRTVDKENSIPSPFSFWMSQGELACIVFRLCGDITSPLSIASATGVEAAVCGWLDNLPYPYKAPGAERNFDAQYPWMTAQRLFLHILSDFIIITVHKASIIEQTRHVSLQSEKDAARERGIKAALRLVDTYQQLLKLQSLEGADRSFLSFSLSETSMILCRAIENDTENSFPRRTEILCYINKALDMLEVLSADVPSSLPVYMTLQRSIQQLQINFGELGAFEKASRPSEAEKRRSPDQEHYRVQKRRRGDSRIHRHQESPNLSVECTDLTEELLEESSGSDFSYSRSLSWDFVRGEALQTSVSLPSPLGSSHSATPSSTNPLTVMATAEATVTMTATSANMLPDMSSRSSTGATRLGQGPAMQPSSGGLAGIHNIEAPFSFLSDGHEFLQTDQHGPSLVRYEAGVGDGVGVISSGYHNSGIPALSVLIPSPLPTVGLEQLQGSCGSQDQPSSSIQTLGEETDGVLLHSLTAVDSWYSIEPGYEYVPAQGLFGDMSFEFGTETEE